MLKKKTLTKKIKIPACSVRMDQIEKIYTLLEQNCEKIVSEIYKGTEEYEIESLNDLRELRNQKITGIVLCGRVTDSELYSRIWVDLTNPRPYLSYPEDSKTSKSLVFDITSVLLKHQRKFYNILSSRILMYPFSISAGYCATAVFSANNKFEQIYYLLLALLSMVGSLLTIFAFSEVIIFSFSENQISFFERNKDSIIVSLIGAFFGAIATLLLTSLLRSG